MEDEEFYYRPGDCQFEETLRLPVITHIYKKKRKNEDDGRVSERERTGCRQKKSDKISQSMLYVRYIDRMI